MAVARTFQIEGSHKSTAKVARNVKGEAKRRKAAKAKAKPERVDV